MMMNTTLDQLRSLKLLGMAAGLQDQLTSAGMTAMSFEERTALLVEREVHWRGDKRRERLLKEARLKYPQAAIEDMDARAGRGIDRKAVMSLALSDWIDSGHSVLITDRRGPANHGLHARWRSTRAGVVAPPTTSACRGWARNCASATATGPSESG